MIELMALPNNTTSQRMFEQHTIDLPPCCPVSKNPRPGSNITISYRAKALVLDIIPLYAYIHIFVGGLRNEQGQLVVRDMEGMLLKIAHDCAQIVQVPVRVTANLIVLPKQQIHVIARGYPQKVSYI